MRGYRSFHNHDTVWVGGYKKGSTWYWKDTEGETPIKLVDWAAGEPNNDGNQQCLSLYGNVGNDESKSYRFDDGKCETPNAYLCQKSYIEEPGL